MPFQKLLQRHVINGYGSLKQKKKEKQKRKKKKKETKRTP
jgi:hypothetical protein